jgi:parvulin-like peptidyl-prolyl isomerase
MAVLVNVNGYDYNLPDAIRRSMIHFDSDTLLDHAIEEMLLRQYAAQNNISNSTEELQLAADELRYYLGLESVEKLQQWLNSNQQTILSVQNGIDFKLLRTKVKDGISDKEIEAYFLEHKLEFDRVDLYSIRLDSLEKAEEFYAQITEKGENFHALTMEHSLDEETRVKAGYIGKVRRNEVSADIETAVFNAQPGEVVGPIKTEKGYNLFKVGAVYPANLEAERDNIRFLLFHNLLSKLRTEAKITYPIFEED